MYMYADKDKLLTRKGIKSGLYYLVGYGALLPRSREILERLPNDGNEANISDVLDAVVIMAGENLLHRTGKSNEEGAEINDEYLRVKSMSVPKSLRDKYKKTARKTSHWWIYPLFVTVEYLRENEADKKDFERLLNIFDMTNSYEYKSAADGAYEYELIKKEAEFSSEIVDEQRRLIGPHNGKTSTHVGEATTEGCNAGSDTIVDNRLGCSIVANVLLLLSTAVCLMW